MTSALLQTTNPFHNKTNWVPRPARNDLKWRYADEGELVRNQDLWDEEANRQRWIEQEVARGNARIAERDAAEARAKQERDDAVLDAELKRRYLAGGGTEQGFITKRREIRSEFAMDVALGRAKPIANDLEQLKRELAARRGHRLAVSDAA